MATSDRPKPPRPVPRDLLPVIRESGILTDRQVVEIKLKIATGDYPSDSTALAGRLVQDKVLTVYQARRFLAGKSSGMLVGRYVVMDRLGEGSMGRVYKAHHMMMDRVVALKIIAPEIVSNAKAIGRFQREMKLVGRLDHPNVIRAFDADQMNNVLYIVMEYAEGQSLAQRLSLGAIPAHEMTDYAAQASLGLAHAHAQGIVHRDVKPSNLLLTTDKKIKVLDLGLGVLMEADSATSFATADGIAVGTVDYMSPEQACGRDVDGRSDLYSLGCATYHLVTGRLPFQGDSPLERMAQRIGGQPVPITDVKPDLPPGFVRVLDKLLATKPQDRYQTAADAAEALQALIRPRTRAASPPRPAPVRPAPPAPTPTPTPAAPEFPKWFRPLARLAVSRPAGALAAVVLAAAATFLLGALAAWLVKG